MHQRAYSVLTIKSVDDDSYVIEGVASTPTPDRYGDIVEPMGAKFSIPMPLLWQHRSDQPVGEVEFAKPTKSGIPFRARLRKPSEFTSETLRERQLVAWESVKAGLVRAVSIGFKSIEHSYMDGGGIHFLEWEWLELSLVTIPAQAEATITAIKSIDTELRAAAGHAQNGRSSRPAAIGNGRSLKSPGAPGTTITVPEGLNMKTIEQRIADLEAARESKRLRMEAINKAAEDDGRTKNETEREEYGDLVKDIEAIDQEIQDQKDLQRIAKRAAPVSGGSTDDASKSRDTRVVVRTVTPKPEPGIRFAQLAMCLFKAKGDTGIALNLLKTHYPQHPAAEVLKQARERGDDYGQFIGKSVELFTKAAVDGGTTAAGSWGAALLAHNEYTADFIEHLRSRTIIGQFGQGSIPALRQIPFNVTIKGQNQGGTGYWVGQGRPKPVTKSNYFDVFHGFKKLAAISVLGDELIRFSNPSAERLVRDSIAGDVIETMDGSFVDTTAADADRPAGLLNSVAGTASAGNDHASVKEDIKALWAPAIAAKLPVSGAVYVTTPSVALSLSLMHGDLSDAPLFPNMSLRGGDLLGIPVIVSDHVAAGDFILVFAPEVYLSDDGTVTVDASREATIEMDTEPENAISDLDGSTPVPEPIGTGHAFVSMFQTNSVALRAERYINWSKRRAVAVNRITGVAWGDAGS